MVLWAIKGVSSFAMMIELETLRSFSGICMGSKEIDEGSVGAFSMLAPACCSDV